MTVGKTGEALSKYTVRNVEMITPCAVKRNHGEFCFTLWRPCSTILQHPYGAMLSSMQSGTAPYSTLCVRFAHLRGGLYKEAVLLQICSNGHSAIVHECNRCPLCALTEHNNTVHDFIESKGRGLVSELVAYQRRKTAEQGERPANVTKQRQPKTVSLCVGCKSVDCSQRSEIGGIVTVCAMRQG